MTRHRKGVRPLSQTGFHRIPLNPRQRNFEEGGAKKKAGVLDAFNETQDERLLHPTKGWRGLNVKRSRAQMLIAEIMSGRRIPSNAQGRFIASGIA
jgi:hypothetical protein